MPCGSFAARLPVLMMFPAKSWGLPPMSTGSMSAGGSRCGLYSLQSSFDSARSSPRDDYRQIGGRFRGRRVETELGGRTRRLLDAMRLLGRRNHLDAA